MYSQSYAQEVIVGTVDGHSVASGTRVATKEELGRTVLSDLIKAGADPEAYPIDTPSLRSSKPS